MRYYCLLSVVVLSVHLCEFHIFYFSRTFAHILTKLDTNSSYREFKILKIKVSILLQGEVFVCLYFIAGAIVQLSSDCHNYR
jgi:hypothetical protein